MLHGTITADGNRWLAYVRLEDPPGLSPVTTVGRYDTVEEASRYRCGWGRRDDPRRSTLLCVVKVLPAVLADQ
jgi:hypothetical protein